MNMMEVELLCRTESKQNTVPCAPYAHGLGKLYSVKTLQSTILYSYSLPRPGPTAKHTLLRMSTFIIYIEYITVFERNNHFSCPQTSQHCKLARDLKPKEEPGGVTWWVYQGRRQHISGRPDDLNGDTWVSCADRKRRSTPKQFFSNTMPRQSGQSHTKGPQRNNGVLKHYLWCTIDYRIRCLCG